MILELDTKSFAMKKSMSEKIIQYKFENSKLGLRAIIAGNLILFFFLIIFPKGNILSNPFIISCLVSALFVFLASLFYDWKNPTIILLLIAIYCSIYFLEFFLFGIPKSVVDMSGDLDKSIMAEMILATMPSVYSLVRIALVIPLIQLYFSAKKLKVLSK